MTLQEIQEFCDRWLASWTGNRPEHVARFYSADAFYRDPARPNGIKGKDALLEYLRKVLEKNPDWVWTAREIIPTAEGFVLKWMATIPTASHTVVIEGLDIVDLRGGEIVRNEVYFDRSPLLNSYSKNAVQVDAG